MHADEVVAAKQKKVDAIRIAAKALLQEEKREKLRREREQEQAKVLRRRRPGA
jgi:hypothetical protein